VVVAHTDNTTISAAFGRNGTRVTVGREDTLKVVKAVKEWAKWRNVLLKVKLVKARDNRLADALSRLAPSNHPAYTSEIKTLVIDGMEARQEGETMIKKITAAGLVYKYALDEETAHLVPLDTPKQESSPIETNTGDTTSWQLVDEIVSPTGNTLHVPSMSAQSDIDEAPNMDGFEQAELPTEVPRDDFNALFRAMQRSQAANAKKPWVRRQANKTARVRAVKPLAKSGRKPWVRRQANKTARFKAVKDVMKSGRMSKDGQEVNAEAVSTQDKDVDAASKDTPAETQTTENLSNTSGPALIEAAQALIKQAQELVKVAEKLVQAAGQKK
jgi:hypothetical protein